ncbi:hypothetical protein K458DRAFT_412491 [Lentithecium fluviatile CBS 122367]|uniref:Uncharacterized protein n=1 Tax=Lentithecium fluviatile CBS 122367 TaxID=1168545 RepID=A0A6G1JKT0_9PLEO|nr:hypothetical protein K458DRAFT_412491 [Lentithecium fluviatile CBS 122367]
MQTNSASDFLYRGECGGALGVDSSRSLVQLACLGKWPSRRREHSCGGHCLTTTDELPQTVRRSAGGHITRRHNIHVENVTSSSNTSAFPARQHRYSRRAAQSSLLYYGRTKHVTCNQALVFVI